MEITRMKRFRGTNAKANQRTELDPSASNVSSICGKVISKEGFVQTRSTRQKTNRDSLLNLPLIRVPISLSHSQCAIKSSGSRETSCIVTEAGKKKRSKNSAVRFAKKIVGKKRKDMSQESADQINKKVQPLTMVEKDDIDSEDLDDETWIAKKKEFWKRNNISPLKIKGGSMSPEELANLLSRTFGP
eukprot:CAMPEP_0170072968 /NCGR_PEP_ID=MMETSP0019_2-20121128/10477_1 /TAXON_ID=98059 /ORGANISM="Dinobryon sp., Strain UTEXLB2267" /LENGTH=187 /DNA_ID=CAMNT_0010282211 /DNA_START=335 /DNA_END=898 /DNA_ORIENTATION=+